MNFVLIRAEKASFLFLKYITRFMSMKFSIIIIQTLVMPILLYCAQIWFPCISQQDISRLEAFYKKNLKITLGVSVSTANAAVYLEMDVFSLPAIIETHFLNFYLG